MIRCQLLAIGFGNETAAGDTQQRVVRFVIVGGRKIRFVGGDNRNPLAICQIDQSGLNAAFLVEAMTLQFDVEPIAEQAGQPVAARGRKRDMIAMNGERDWPFRTARERDQVVGRILQPFELDVRRLMGRRFEKRPGIDPHQAAISALASRQQHNPRWSRGKRVAGVGILIAEIDRNLAANYGLNAITGQLVRKFQRPEHIVGIGQGQRRLAIGLRQFSQLLDLDRSLQQRIGRMDV